MQGLWLSPRPELERADKCSRYLVRHPCNVSLWKNFPHEFKFGGASQTEAGGDRPDGTAMQRESAALLRNTFYVGHVPLFA